MHPTSLRRSLSANTVNSKLNLWSCRSLHAREEQEQEAQVSKKKRAENYASTQKDKAAAGESCNLKTGEKRLNSRTLRFHMVEDWMPFVVHATLVGRARRPTDRPCGSLTKSGYCSYSVVTFWSCKELVWSMWTFGIVWFVFFSIFGPCAVIFEYFDILIL
jgi:hypothetical protein